MLTISARSQEDPENEHWIFTAKGNIKEIREIIKNRRWSFVIEKFTYSYKNRRWGNEKKFVRPEHLYELKPGDFVLFYLSQKSKDGKSIIAKARLGSPFLEEAKYTERNGNPINLTSGVFLCKPDVNFFKKIEPNKYGIGRGGRGIFIIPISDKEYDSIVNDKDAKNI